MINFMFLKSRQQWAKGALVFLAVLGFMTFLKDEVELVHSASNSLSYRMFLKFKRVSPQKGSYTSFNSAWYGGPVIKKIVGTAGDTLIYDRQGFLWLKGVNGRALKIGKAKNKSKDGRILTPFKAKIIPPNMVFVVGEHERSFDSRYEELGLIPEHALQGRLIGLL